MTQENRSSRQPDLEMIQVRTTGISKIIIACGRTDLRKGIDGLAQLVGTRYDMNPFEKNVLFLFCGGRGDRIKGLLWEGNGFLLLYKRLEDGSFSWPVLRRKPCSLHVSSTKCL